MVYYNDNGKIRAYDNEEIYEKYVKYDSAGNDRGMVKITLEEAQAIREAAIPLELRIYRMEGLAASIVTNECRDKKYFYGYGFANGDKSIRRFSEHPDAILLAEWEKTIWAKIEEWISEINAGTTEATVFTTTFIAENLPIIV